jgi:peptidylprolyl isomerase
MMYDGAMVGVGMLVAMSQLTKLKIDDVQIGKGKSAESLDVIEVQYTGTLMDGKKFDSSFDRNEPFQFQLGVGAVIKGWDQGVKGMKIGGERNLEIPADLAYGDRGAGDVIPANSDLKFNIKLVNILPRIEIQTIKKGKGAGLGLDQGLDCKLSMKAEKTGKEMSDPKQVSNLAIDRRLIPGINQAIYGIKVGEKRRVIVPSALAFGKQGVPVQDQGEVKKGSYVAPNEKIILEIEAIKITNLGS